MARLSTMHTSAEKKNKVMNKNTLLLHNTARLGPPLISAGDSEQLTKSMIHIVVYIVMMEDIQTEGSLKSAKLDR